MAIWSCIRGLETTVCRRCGREVTVHTPHDARMLVVAGLRLPLTFSAQERRQDAARHVKAGRGLRATSSRRSCKAQTCLFARDSCAPVGFEDRRSHSARVPTKCCVRPWRRRLRDAVRSTVSARALPFFQLVMPLSLLLCVMGPGIGNPRNPLKSHEYLAVGKVPGPLRFATYGSRAGYYGPALWKPQSARLTALRV